MPPTGGAGLVARAVRHSTLATMPLLLKQPFDAALPAPLHVVSVSVTEAGWLDLSLADRTPRASATLLRLRLSPERAHDAPVKSSLGGWFALQPGAALALPVARLLSRTPSWVKPVLSVLPHLALDSRRGVDLATSVARLRELGVLAAPDPEQSRDGPFAATPRELFERLARALERAGPPLPTLALERVELEPGAEPGGLLVLQLRASGRRLPRLIFGLARRLERPFVVLGPAALSIDHGGHLDAEALPFEVAAAASWVAAWLAVVGDRELETGELATLPSFASAASTSWPQDPPADDDSAPGAGEAARADDELALELSSDCGQACTFCEIRDVLTPHDGGQAALAASLRKLELARRAGASRLHLGGVDPLGFSLLLELVAGARELGYTALTVTTPGRRLADPTFRRALRAASPAAVRAVIPLYGIEATTHDAVVGAPGARTEVMQALEGLAAEWGVEQVTVMLVGLERNVEELPALVRWAFDRGFPVLAQPVYPMSGGASAAWRASRVRESRVALAFQLALEQGGSGSELGARLLHVLAMLVPHPCIRKAVLSQEDWTRDERVAPARLALPGLDSGSMSERRRLAMLPSVLVPCPQREGCGSLARCPAAFYRAYVEEFGLEEVARVLLPRSGDTPA